MNGQIRVPTVRLIDNEGQQIGIVSTSDALARAEAAKLDLVEISPNAEPPVCRIMDYGKYQFEQNKQRNKQKKKQHQVQVKEIKFRPVTDIGDFNVKLKRIKSFLEDGNKVKITVRFRGREMQHKELGMDILKRVHAGLSGEIAIEQQPKLEGRQMAMVVAPHKDKDKNKTTDKSTE